MKPNNQKEKNMEIMMGLVLPIIVVVFTFASKRYEQRRAKEQHDAVVRQAAIELLNEIKKSLPSG